MNKIRSVIDDIIQRVPGVVGVLLIDIDGIPIEIVGDFSMNKEDLGAILATCYNSYAQVGTELGQGLESILVEFGNLKLCQNGMPRGLLTIIARKDSTMGMIRLEAKRAIERITALMRETQEIRQDIMHQNKFRWPDGTKIEDVIARLMGQFK